MRRRKRIRDICLEADEILNIAPLNCTEAQRQGWEKVKLPSSMELFQKLEGGRPDMAEQFRKMIEMVEFGCAFFQRFKVLYEKFETVLRIYSFSLVHHFILFIFRSSLFTVRTNSLYRTHFTFAYTFPATTCSRENPSPVVEGSLTGGRCCQKDHGEGVHDSMIFFGTVIKRASPESGPQLTGIHY